MSWRVYHFGHSDGPLHDTEQEARDWMDKFHPHLRFIKGPHYSGFSIREEGRQK